MQGEELLCQPDDMMTLQDGSDVDFLDVEKTEVELDETGGDDVWSQAESCPILERPLAEIELFGPEHAVKVLELGGC